MEKLKERKKGWKWGEGSILKNCPCGNKFKCFISSNQKFCSLKCSGKYKIKVSFWKDKKMPKTMKKNLSIGHQRMWDEGKMDNRKKLLGDLNHSKKPKVKAKIRKTHEENGLWTPLSKLTEWQQYKRNVNILTNKTRKELFSKWNGYCFYCNRFIKNQKKWSKFEPTIDHKVSIFFGFHNKLNYEFIADIRNLCISCRSCNCSKRENAR